MDNIFQNFIIEEMYSERDTGGAVVVGTAGRYFPFLILEVLIRMAPNQTQTRYRLNMPRGRLRELFDRFL